VIQLLTCFDSEVLITYEVSKVAQSRNLEFTLTEISTSSSWMANGLPRVIETNLNMVVSVADSFSRVNKLWHLTCPSCILRRIIAYAL